MCIVAASQKSFGRLSTFVLFDFVGATDRPFILFFIFIFAYCSSSLPRSNLWMRLLRIWYFILLFRSVDNLNAFMAMHSWCRICFVTFLSSLFRSPGVKYLEQNVIWILHLWIKHTLCHSIERTNWWMDAELKGARVCVICDRRIIQFDMVYRPRILNTMPKHSINENHSIAIADDWISHDLKCQISRCHAPSNHQTNGKIKLNSKRIHSLGKRWKFSPVAVMQ